MREVVDTPPELSFVVMDTVIEPEPVPFTPAAVQSTPNIFVGPPTVIVS